LNTSLWFFIVRFKYESIEKRPFTANNQTLMLMKH